jgi:hypothetical protein
MGMVSLVEEYVRILHAGTGVYALSKPSYVHESNGAAQGVDLSLGIRHSPQAVVERVQGRGFASLEGLIPVFGHLVRHRARPHPAVFGVWKGAGVDAKMEGGAFGAINALTVDAFEKWVVREKARLFTRPGSPGLEFELVALRRHEGRVGRRGRGGSRGGGCGRGVRIGRR